MSSNVPRHAISISSSGALVGTRCVVCGKYSCPPRIGHCDRPMEPVDVAPRGRVESYSDVRIAPPELKPPYRIAYVRLDAGPRVVARLEGELSQLLDPTDRIVQLTIAHNGLGGSPALVATAVQAENGVHA